MRTKLFVLVSLTRRLRSSRFGCPRLRRVHISIVTTPSLASRSRKTPRARRSMKSDDLYEMTYNLFVQPGYKPSGRRAQNVNTIDEVPDSGWFTNRIGTRPSHERRTRPWSYCRRPARSLALDRHRGKRPPAFIRA